jgi:nitrite reductase (NADH) large subunit
MRWYVIVGNGVAGVTAAQTIVRADSSAEVHILGLEPYPYYRRPLLWEFIAGQIERDALYFRPPAWYAGRGIQLHLGIEATMLDPTAHRLALADGSQVEYDRLLLATGCRPFVPPCEGTDKAGVFTLRTLDDAQAIKAYSPPSSPPVGGTEGGAVVIGGGLLGLETARALRTTGLEVTVVEFFPHLLPRQLDAEGAEVLQSLLEAQGLRIITSGATESVLGDGRADGIRLQDGRVVPAGLVLFSTGVRSEVALAQAAGLGVNRGIVVDEQLQTRWLDGHPAEDVFAAGDAAEFEGQVYGIIPPAIEQARVAAANMVAPGSATYSGTLPSTTLKVAGAELTSLGESVVEAEEYDQLRHTDLAAGHYRKFVLREGRIVGAILLNDKERTQPVRQLVEQGVNVSAHTNRLLDDDFDLKSLLQTEPQA